MAQDIGKHLHPKQSANLRCVFLSFWAVESVGICNFGWGILVANVPAMRGRVEGEGVVSRSFLCFLRKSKQRKWRTEGMWRWLWQYGPKELTIEISWDFLSDLKLEMILFPSISTLGRIFGSRTPPKIIAGRPRLWYRIGSNWYWPKYK